MGNGQYPSLAHHACEQPFVFHVLSETGEEKREDHGTYHIDPSESKFSAQIVNYWASFAASGVPTASATWPKYDPKNQSAIVFGDDMKIEGQIGLRRSKCDLWDALFDRNANEERRFG